MNVTRFAFVSDGEDRSAGVHQNACPQAPPAAKSVRMYKPCQIPENGLTGRPVLCIIYGMFVFGRSLLPLSEQRSKAQGTRTDDSPGQVVMARACVQISTPCARRSPDRRRTGQRRSLAHAHPDVCQGFFQRAFTVLRNFTVHSPCLPSGETEDSLCRAPPRRTALSAPARSPVGCRCLYREIGKDCTNYRYE